MTDEVRSDNGLPLGISPDTDNQPQLGDTLGLQQDPRQNSS